MLALKLKTAGFLDGLGDSASCVVVLKERFLAFARRDDGASAGVVDCVAFDALEVIDRLDILGP